MTAPVNRKATNTSGSQLTVPGTSTPLGYQQLTPTVATSLTVPAGATWCLISTTTQNIRIRDDGVAPDSTHGVVIPTGVYFQYTGTLSKLQMIQVASAATVDVLYYS